ncbi:SufE family protein [Pseudoalteromonas sp. T1lg65]|uniref:SufE family protein n=1 Tax=Pseudoalteromonas sp. T1lg65 TaxID=2077101 RepID=UPI003F78EFE7
MNIEQIKAKLNSLTGWQAKYREIMLLGKHLPALPEALKTDDHLVQGCESKVWLYLDLDDSMQHLVIVADSDTRIVKGLLAVIISMYSGLTPSQASSVDAYEQFDALGLISHLSPSRGNGVKAIVEKIQSHCSNLC